MYALCVHQMVCRSCPLLISAIISVGGVRETYDMGGVGRWANRGSNRYTMQEVPAVLHELAQPG